MITDDEIRPALVAALEKAGEFKMIPQLVQAAYEELGCSKQFQAWDSINNFVRAEKFRHIYLKSQNTLLIFRIGDPHWIRLRKG